MPDLPVPHDTLTPNMLHERPPGFFCRRSDSGERHRFRLGLRLPTFSGLSVSSSSSSRAALSTARESPSNADSFVPGPSGSSLPVTPRSFTDEASIYPSPLSFSRSAPAPEINQSDSWKNSFQYQTTSNRTSQSGSGMLNSFHQTEPVTKPSVSFSSDGAIEARTSKVSNSRCSDLFHYFLLFRVRVFRWKRRHISLIFLRLGSSHDLLSDQGNSAEVSTLT